MDLFTLTQAGDLLFQGQMIGGQNGIEINFSNGDVIDKSDSNIVCANFVDGKLKDGTNDSIHWTGRQLFDSQGASVLTWDGDVELAPGRGLIIRSPNGTRYRWTPDDNGNVISVAV